MSADITSALSAGQPRPTPAAAPPPEAMRAQAAAAVQTEKPAKAAPAMPEKAQLTIDPEQRQQELRAAIDQLNEQMRQNGRALAFSIDEQSKRTVVTVTNQETGQVIRQFPDETILRVAHNLDRVKGLLADDSI